MCTRENLMCSLLSSNGVLLQIKMAFLKCPLPDENLCPVHTKGKPGNSTIYLPMD